jgi:hypothetical protein
MARDDFPAQSEGFVLTHFIVADGVARSRDFYTGVLGGTAVMGGEPTIVKLDPPRRRLEGQPCQVRQVGARNRTRRHGQRRRLATGRCRSSRVGRGKGAWWIQIVETEWLRTLAAASFPTATGAWCGHRLARPRQPLGDRGRPPRWRGRRAARLRVRGSPSLLGWRHANRAAVRFFRREQGHSKGAEAAGAGGGRWA